MMELHRIGPRRPAHGHVVLFLSGIILLLTHCTHAANKPEHLTRGDYTAVAEYIRALAHQEMSDHDVVGMSVALVDDQRVVWAEGFGYADKAGNIEASPETMYRVGSITQLFTASAVMQLAEQGTLDIDQPLQTYLPDFRIKTRFPRSTAITLRNVMTHHSGLPQNYRKGMVGANLPPFQLLAQQLRSEYMEFPPDLLFSYSYLGFTLLGNVLETVTGVPYVEYINRVLFQPLKMTRSTLSSQPPPVTKRYRKGEETVNPSWRWVPAGGMHSSVIDLSKFLSMVFAQGTSQGMQVLQPETVDEMLRSQQKGNPLDRNFQVGLGWMLSSLERAPITGAGLVAHHGGGPVLFGAQLIALPEQKLGVVVLANSDSARKAVNTIATETLKLALQAKTGIRQPSPQDVVAGETPPPSEHAQHYVGPYTTLAGLAWVKWDGSRLTAEMMGETVSLYLRTDGQLGMKYLFFGLIPINIEELNPWGFSLQSVAGRDVLIAKVGKQELLVGEKIKPITLSETWMKRLGTYELLNLGDDYPIFQSLRADYEDGVMFVDVKLNVGMDRPFRFAIQPLSASEAVMLRNMAGMGETLRAVPSDDGSEVLEFSGYRFKKTI